MPIVNHVVTHSLKTMHKETSEELYKCTEKWRELKLSCDIKTADIIEHLKKTFPEEADDIPEIALDDLMARVVAYRDHLESKYKNGNYETRTKIEKDLKAYRSYANHLETMRLANVYNWILDSYLRTTTRNYVTVRKMYLRNLCQLKKIAKTQSGNALGGSS